MRIIYIPRSSTPLANSIYGLLYNWHSASDSRGFVSGWHLPSETELDTFLSVVGLGSGVLKEIGTTYWTAPNSGATNEYGFNARGAGWRSGFDGLFNDINDVMRIWTSTQSGGNAIQLLIGSTNQKGLAYKRHGYSIRLLCDSSTNPGYVDIDGKRYTTVTIGTQVWMAENLQATHFANGDTISEVTDNTEWSALTTPGLCAYDNDWNNV